MKCEQFNGAILCSGRNTFDCPICGKPNTEEYGDKLSDHICHKDLNWARATCEHCGKKFRVTITMMNDLIAFK